MYAACSVKRKKLFLCLLISMIPGEICGFLIRKEAASATQDLPVDLPQPAVFTAVWILFYILMGIGFFGILCEGRGIGNQIYIFILQYCVNLCWPFLFFKWKAYSFALIWLSILIACVLGMVILFFMRKRWAGLLQLPYLLWLFCSFYWNYETVRQESAKIFKVFTDFLDMLG